MSNIFSILELESNPSYVEELEKKYAINLPPIFKAFVKTFRYGKLQPTPEHYIIHTNEEIGFDGFNHSLEKVFLVYREQGELYKTPELLPVIISGFYHFGICLGIGNDNSDKIFLFEDHDELIPVAENILEFISNLKKVRYK